MTENKEQQNISYEELMDDMQSRFGRMLENYEYNGYEYATKFDALEDLVCDLVDDGSDEQERLAQEASDKVLRDFSRMLPDTEVGGQSGGSRLSSGAVPDISVDNLPILTSPLAPGIVTRGYLCNSSPNSPIPVTPDVTPEIKHGGFDGGALNCFFGTWNEDAFVTLVGHCESVKSRVSMTRQCNPDDKSEPEILTLAGRCVVVHSGGSRIGQVYYAYHISFEGYDVFIHKDLTPKNDNPQIWVDYRAESILKYGSLYAAQDVLLVFLLLLGFTKVRERPSRIDIQGMIDVPVSAFTKLYLGDHDVGKGRNFTINGKKKAWGKVIETFNTGTENRLELCMYCKRSEIRKKYNDETAAKYDKTIENIGKEWWESDRPVTRIEFRLHREALKAFGVESLEDFHKRERAIVKYLTTDWFRLLEKPKVRGTENDAAIHPLWKRVQNLFFQYFSCAEIPAVKWKKPTLVSVDCNARIKQGLGNLAMAAVAKSGEQRSPSALRNRTCELVHYSKDEVEKYNGRIRRIEVEKGIKFVDQMMVGFDGERVSFHDRR